MEKRKQVSINNGEKQEGTRAENSLMKDVKVENQFLEEVRKKKQEKQEKAKKELCRTS